MSYVPLEDDASPLPISFSDDTLPQIRVSSKVDVKS